MLIILFISLPLEYTHTIFVVLFFSFFLIKVKPHTPVCVLHLIFDLVFSCVCVCSVAVQHDPMRNPLTTIFIFHHYSQYSVYPPPLSSHVCVSPVLCSY